MSDDRKPKLLSRDELLAALTDIAYTMGHGTPKDDRVFTLQSAKRFADSVLDGRNIGESARGVAIGACTVLNVIVEGPHCPPHLRTEEWAKALAAELLAAASR